MSAIKRYIEDEAERLGVTFDEVLHPTPDDSEISVPSCFTCKHVKTWHHPQTREEPEDSGWECNHPNQTLINENWIEPSDDGFGDKQMAFYCADRCPGYEFFDLEAQRIATEKALATELEAQARYVEVYKEFEVIELCSRCSSPMEHQASEAPNNACSDAEWYHCPTCDYETEVS